jgi:heparosan-N-sulfate-glucuronate 5-epimerase
MRFRAAAGAAVLAASVAGAAVGSERRYDSAGAYLHYAQLASLVRPPTSLDSTGIPRVTYSRGRSARLNPVTIAQYGLQEFSYFVSRRGQSHLRNATRAAVWLVRNQDHRGRWLYRFDWRLRGSRMTVRHPWASAMAQGQAMSLLTRMFRRTRDGRYLRAALRAQLPLRRAVDDGGLVAIFRGRRVYEEYPTRRPSLVLNGFMFTLLGLHDLQSTYPTPRTQALLDEGLDSLAALLPLYDRRAGSLYDLGHLTGARSRPRPAGARYHRKHIRLLAVLSEVSGRPGLAFH